MSIECEFRSNGVIIWHSGIITGNDLIHSNKDIYSHKYDEGLKFQLADLTEVEEFDVSSEDIRKLTKMDLSAKKDKKQFVCVVAPVGNLPVPPIGYTGSFPLSIALC